ncbi:MAG: shikimate kinase [Opitutales bacterium]|nr:shikimate kinase [Opitutales bacterium]
MRENQTTSRQPNLILTGFMGTGKSSVGRLLARLWHRPFLDTDKEIERRTRRKIKDIFAEDGEVFFRNLERQCVDEWLPESGAIIATGGGILTSSGMREKLRSRGIVITLFASPETIYARTRNGNRPLLQTEYPTARIRELLAVREKDYLLAGIGVLTDGRTMLELAQNITRIYRREMRATRVAAQK